MAEELKLSYESENGGLRGGGLLGFALALTFFFFFFFFLWWWFCSCFVRVWFGGWGFVLFVCFLLNTHISLFQNSKILAVEYLKETVTSLVLFNRKKQQKTLHIQ